MYRDRLRGDAGVRAGWPGHHSRGGRAGVPGAARAPAAARRAPGGAWRRPAAERTASAVAGRARSGPGIARGPYSAQRSHAQVARAHVAARLPDTERRRHSCWPGQRVPAAPGVPRRAQSPAVHAAAELRSAAGDIGLAPTLVPSVCASGRTSPPEASPAGAGARRRCRRRPRRAWRTRPACGMSGGAAGARRSRTAAPTRTRPPSMPTPASTAPTPTRPRATPATAGAARGAAPGAWWHSWACIAGA